MVIGLDIGYGYTKVASAYEDYFVFKTAVSRFIPERIWGNGADYVVIGTNKYIVGDAANELLSGNFSVSDDFVGTDEYYAIIASVLHKFSQKDIKLLVLGLPPGLYNEQKTVELINKIKNITMYDKNGKTIPAPPEVLYIPQGSGIYFSHVLGGFGSDFNLNIVVVDVGYYTLDTICFAKGKFISSAARSYPAGSKFLIEKVKESFNRKYGIFISDALCEILLRNKQISHFGKEYVLDTADIVQQYYHDQVVRAIKDYASNLRQIGITVDRVIMGGGAIVWTPDLKGAVVVNNPQMANAIGYMKYGKSLLKNN